MKKRILIFGSVVLAAVIGYIAGYKSAPARDRQRSEMKFRVTMGQRLHQHLLDGQTNRALSEIRFVLWNDTVAYERAFGAPTGADSFARRFAEAKAITAQVEPELRTNAQRFEREVKALLATNNIIATNNNSTKR